MELGYASGDSRGFWQVVWDAIKGLFVWIAYAVVDGIAVLLKQLIYSAVYD